MWYPSANLVPGVAIDHLKDCLIERVWEWMQGNHIIGGDWRHEIEHAVEQCQAQTCYMGHGTTWDGANTFVSLQRMTCQAIVAGRLTAGTWPIGNNLSPTGQTWDGANVQLLGWG